MPTAARCSPRDTLPHARRWRRSGRSRRAWTSSDSWRPAPTAPRWRPSLSRPLAPRPFPDISGSVGASPRDIGALDAAGHNRYGARMATIAIGRGPRRLQPQGQPQACRPGWPRPSRGAATPGAWTSSPSWTGSGKSRRSMQRLAEVDPDVAKALREEAQRQNRNLELIASENFVSEAVLEAAGSVLTNKYAEGYPGRRYYGGCEVVDVVEDLAIARAKELFGAEHANVQPHSGAQANMAVYFTLLKPGDTVLGPNLSHGGHLTAGSPVNYSGKFYSIVAYGVREDTERIDLDQVRDLARQHRPKLIIAGGSAFPRAIDFKPFGEIAKEVGAALMADIAHPAGLVAAGP